MTSRWFFFAIGVGAALLNSPLPAGLTQEGMIVLAMSVVATILFITEPVPLPTVALLVIVGEVVLLGQDSTDVAKSLMTDSVLFIMGSLMLAVAVVRQKLDQRIAWYETCLAAMESSDCACSKGDGFVHGMGLAVYRGAVDYLKSHRQEFLEQLSNANRMVAE